MSQSRSVTRAVAAAMLLVAIAAAPSIASAQLTGPVWPAPGGNGYSASGGPAIAPGGVTGTYYGFDTSQFDELYWTYEFIKNPWFSVGAPPSGYHSGYMAFVSYDASTGVARWQSTSNFVFTDAFGIQRSTATYFTALLQAVGGGSLTVTTAGALGITGPGIDPDQVVVDNSSGGDFQVTGSYFAANGTALKSYYESYATIPDGRVNTSSSGGFWYSEQTAVVPEPSSIVLLATGLAGVAVAARRRRRSAP